MAHPPNLFALKLVVISLGLALLGGIVFVLATVAHEARGEMHAPPCPDATLRLEHRGTLAAVTPQGKTVQLTLQSDGQTKVLTVERCTGTILQTLTVAP
jgi:hypothetical protein